MRYTGQTASYIQLQNLHCRTVFNTKIPLPARFATFMVSLFSACHGMNVVWQGDSTGAAHGSDELEEDCTISWLRSAYRTTMAEAFSVASS
jgi:hypothetical protein